MSLGGKRKCGCLCRQLRLASLSIDKYFIILYVFCRICYQTSRNVMLVRPKQAKNDVYASIESLQQNINLKLSWNKSENKISVKQFVLFCLFRFETKHWNNSQTRRFLRNASLRICIFADVLVNMQTSLETDSETQSVSY